MRLRGHRRVGFISSFTLDAFLDNNNSRYSRSRFLSLQFPAGLLSARYNYSRVICRVDKGRLWGRQSPQVILVTQIEVTFGKTAFFSALLNNKAHELIFGEPILMCESNGHFHHVGKLFGLFVSIFLGDKFAVLFNELFWNRDAKTSCRYSLNLRAPGLPSEPGSGIFFVVN